MLEGGMRRNARMIKCLLVWFEVSTQPRSQGYLLPALRSERERGRVGENPGNEVGEYAHLGLIDSIFFLCWDMRI